MSKLLSSFFCILLISCLTQAQTLKIIPVPVKAEAMQGTFSISPDTKIVVSAPGAEKSAAFLNDYLKRFYGFELKTSKDKTGNAIDLSVTNASGNSIPGAYNMKVSSN